MMSPANPPTALPSRVQGNLKGKPWLFFTEVIIKKKKKTFDLFNVLHDLKPWGVGLPFWFAPAGLSAGGLTL